MRHDLGHDVMNLGDLGVDECKVTSLWTART
jgi:hypothetical protein